MRVCAECGWFSETSGGWCQLYRKSTSPEALACPYFWPLRILRVRVKCCGAIIEGVFKDLELATKTTWCPECQRYSKFEVLKRDVKLPETASPIEAIFSSPEGRVPPFSLGDAAGEKYHDTTLRYATTAIPQNSGKER